MSEVYSAFMPYRVAVCAFCLCLSVTTAGLAAKRKPDLGASINQALSASPAAMSAFWGIQVLDLASGKVVYQHNADKFFVPASNAKLFSSVLALQTLGPGHRFVTRVLANAISDNGVIRGDLRLLGGGDPNLSGRILPYSVDAKPGDPLAVINKLADEVAARGIRQITGDVLGDDTLYPHEPFPPGWGLADPVDEYGAPVSALSVTDNAVRLTMAPATGTGDPVRISFDPPVEYFSVQNEIRTIDVGVGFPGVDRAPGGRQLLLSGAMLRTASPRVVRLAVENPALYAAFLLHDALERRGVRVDGEPRAAHRSVEVPYLEPEGSLLAKHESEPLATVLQIVNKESQNLHAELVLRAAARAQSGEGSRRNGVKALEAFLVEIGVPPKSYDFHDGSGLSRITLVKPSAVVSLLRWVWTSPHREVMLAALPVGGRDGTLKLRFAGTPSASAIHAKTGSLTHVTALGGFALPRSGRKYAFSIMVNNFGAPASEIRTVVDKIAMLLIR